MKLTDSESERCSMSTEALFATADPAGWRIDGVDAKPITSSGAASQVR